jgi:hypothetical protein
VDEDRRAILARRARLIAAAMAGVGLAGAKGCAPDRPAEPCLQPQYVEPEVVVPDVDASTVESEDGDAALPERQDAGARVEEPPIDEAPPPRICLSEM